MGVQELTAPSGRFPDYDCRWAGPLVGAAGGEEGPTWSDLRERLRASGTVFASSALSLAELALAAANAATVCVLGLFTACMALHLAGRRPCELADRELPLLPSLATSWPLLRLLAAAQREWPGSPGLDCAGLRHPSVDWDAFHGVVQAYADEPFEEEKQETLMTEQLHAATDVAGGIIWKYSSAAQYEGRSIAAWTRLCPLGTSLAFALRVTSLVLGELDVFKMVEASLQQIEETVLFSLALTDVLASRWPLFALLHKLSCMRKREDSLALAPGDLQLDPSLPRQPAADFAALSPWALQAAQALLVAAPGPILVTFVRVAYARFLEGYVRRASELGFIHRTLFLPQAESVLEMCGRAEATCLPVLSVYPELAKYGLLALSSRLGVDVLFAELDVYWVQNPLPLLPRHRDAAADVFVAEEFYSNQTRPGVLLVRSTERSMVAMANLATWLLRFPFSVERPALRYLLEPDRPAFVPSVSLLRADRLEERGSLRLEVFDAENAFVTSDGWFGEFERLVCFEPQPAIHGDLKLAMLEAFYGSLQGSGAASKILAGARKAVTPKRPMEALQHGGPLGGLRAGAVAPVEPGARVLHVNFADGCCEVEQAKSSSTAMLFGANASRALKGDFLSHEFRRRNERLLAWERTEALTSGKTPSGKVGYYVWKPYVLLETLRDPAVEEGSIVVYTDAGVHFIAPMRPLVQAYLGNSDVSATETPMMEADVTKRDAFVLLDADYPSIIQTNQVATGIIMARKTPLATRFAEHWLRACEDPRIITEEPSELGLPDYFTFRHHNDDQSAFSLLFKKYGFRAFSQAERDEVVLAARNVAKFVAASDAFALGGAMSQDGYISAANAAAEAG